LADGDSNETVIGYAAIGNGSNSVTLGNDSVTKTILKGNVGIGTASPTAYLHLKAGTATAGTAPLKFTSGTNLTTPEAGTMEYDGTQLYFSPSTTRNILAQISGSTALTTGSIAFATTGGYLTQDNANFFWDNVNKRLGLGTSSPSATLEVKGTIENGLVGWWPMDDGNGATVADRSIGGHNGTITSLACPTGYVLVPGNATYGTADFCVMKYEAKSVGGVATSQADVAPWTQITQTDAITACSSAGGHLITNNEWMTIARNAEAQAANWADGKVGSLVSTGGGLKRGNVGVGDSASYNGADPEYGTRNAEAQLKAQLVLSNGETIWDLSGNVWEWTNDTISCAGANCTSAEMPYDATPAEEWVEFPNISTYGQLSYDKIRPSNSSWNSTYGVGKLYTDTNAAYPSGNVHAFLRGGDWSIGAPAGAFTLNLYHAPGDSYDYLGFRCVR